MRTFLNCAVIAALSTPAFCTDLMVSQSKHSDAIKISGREVRPAKDTNETIWIGKDRMRVDDGDKVTIIRLDQKKMYLLDPAEKTVSTLDLPVDMAKYLPEDQAPMYAAMMKDTKVSITPTTETKKIKDWNATKYTMTMSMPMPGPMGGEMSFTSDIWASKDIAVDRAAMNDMYGAMMSMAPGGSSLATEMKKVEGMPVLVERTQSMMGNDSKSTEEVTAVASKDAPEGSYDVPKDYTAKPFDPRSQGMGGGGKHRGKPADASGEGHKSGEKGGEKGGG